MRKFTKYPRGYIKASSESDDIKYYEIELANVNGDEDLEPNADDTYCMCILGKREPSIKEAEEFLANDMKKLGYNCVVFVAEITPEEADAFYDMRNKANFPVFSSSCVKSTSGINPYMKDLAEYLDYLSDAEIDELSIDTEFDSPDAWMIIPDHLRDTVEKAVGLEYCSPDENYYYYIEYHPDDDSIHFGIDTDMNFETLRGVSKQTEDRFKAKFKKELGI